jgi:hypothetical protein
MASKDLRWWGPEVPWWHNVLGGLGCFAAAGVTYWYFADFEASGGTRTINAVAALLYKLGGKGLVSGLIAATGLAVFGNGVYKLVTASAKAGNPAHSTGHASVAASKCGSCGLVNAVDDGICRRCGAALGSRTGG